MRQSGVLFRDEGVNINTVVNSAVEVKSLTNFSIGAPRNSDFLHRTFHGVSTRKRECHERIEMAFFVVFAKDQRRMALRWQTARY